MHNSKGDIKIQINAFVSHLLCISILVRAEWPAILCNLKVYVILSDLKKKPEWLYHQFLIFQAELVHTSEILPNFEFSLISLIILLVSLANLTVRKTLINNLSCKWVHFLVLSSTEMNDSWSNRVRESWFSCDHFNFYSFSRFCFILFFFSFCQKH